MVHPRRPDRDDGIRRHAVHQHGLLLACALLLWPMTVLAAASQQAVPVTFSADIAPIFFQHCASCHQPGGVAPFSVLSYTDVRPRAARIASVVQSRQMPPWKPDPGFGEFAGARRLSMAQIELVTHWARDGALEGNRADLPALPRSTGGWQLGTPDLIVDLPLYELAAGGGDRFRNFAVTIPGFANRYVRGLEFHPNGSAVHHANIFVDATPTSRLLDDEDPLPGYEGIIPYSASFPDGHFLGWTPGQVAPLGGADQGWRLDAGSSLLVQAHLMSAEYPQHVQPTIGLYFTDAAPSRPPAMLRLGRQNLDIAAGERAYLTTDSYVLPVDVQVQGVQPHAHHRAAGMKAWAMLPDGTRRWLVSISEWDFGWQDQYRYESPFWLPKGTTLNLEYTFDNSATNRRNPDAVPRRVVWGQRSSDEMADLWVQVLTHTGADLVTLNSDMRSKMVLEDIAGHEVELRSHPDSVIIHNDVAVLYLESGRPVQAAAHFAAVTRLQPRSAAARFNLGSALGQAGRLADSIDQYTEAVGLDPAYAKALKALANALLVSGRVPEAAGRFRDLIALVPADPEGYNNLGFCQLASGDVAGATRSLEQALALRAAYPDAHFNMARALSRAGLSARAEDHLREALRIRADWIPAMTELARVLSAGPANPRRTAEAVRLATRAAQLTERKDADVLVLLGATYASAGSFDEAVSALAEARSTGSLTTGQLREIDQQLDAYRSRRR
jgi:Flp pilus assembly protein TadD/mono/diheme cytochrome c family protein